MNRRSTKWLKKEERAGTVLFGDYKAGSGRKIKETLVPIKQDQCLVMKKSVKYIVNI